MLWQNRSCRKMKLVQPHCLQLWHNTHLYTLPVHACSQLLLQFMEMNWRVLKPIPKAEKQCTPLTSIIGLTQRDTQPFAAAASSETPINHTCMTLDCGKKLEYPNRKAPAGQQIQTRKLLAVWPQHSPLDGIFLNEVTKVL